MSNKPEEGSFPPLTCDELLYRPIIYEYWIDRRTGAVKPHAFRRRAADRHGLSVNLVSSYSILECVECTDYTECFAVGTLHVGCIRDITLRDGICALLDVHQDSPTHANILGLPAKDQTGPPHDENREHLANLLARQWRSVWRSLKVRPRKSSLEV